MQQQNPPIIVKANEKEEEKLQNSDVQMEIVDSNQDQSLVSSQHKMNDTYLKALAKSNHQLNRDSIDSTILFENLDLSHDESDQEINAL